MNYKESKQILKEINKAKNIIINCHRSPDADSVGSSLAIFRVLKSLNKDVAVICPSHLSESLIFLPNSEVVEKINFKNFKFEKYDLFICIDSSGVNLITGDWSIKLPEIPVINIDHHKTNSKYGKLNLVDSKVVACAEIIFLVLEDWKAEIDKETATLLLAGILGDSGVFQYPGVTARTIEISLKLIKKGAEKDDIIFNLNRSIDFKDVKFWGEVIRRMHKDDKNKFIWSAISYEVFEKFSKSESGKESAASMFTQCIKETDFGMVMVEETKGNLSVSFRSRTGFDTSNIATALGGGGHIYSSGAKVEGMEFDEAVEKVLSAARKFAQKK